MANLPNGMQNDTKQWHIIILLEQNKYWVQFKLEKDMKFKRNKTNLEFN